MHGRWYRGGRRHDDFYVEPEHCAETDNQYSRPRRECLRTWCGDDATDRFDELAELRKEVRRVGEIAQSAINALCAAGRRAEAAGLQRELGIPLDMVRPAPLVRWVPGAQATRHEALKLRRSDLVGHLVGQPLRMIQRIDPVRFLPSPRRPPPDLLSKPRIAAFRRRGLQAGTVAANGLGLG